MDSKISIKKELIQHTPILHFQHSNDDAFLRATEVKPKLDKYLEKRKEGWDNIPKNWKSSSEHKSLNYKLSFRVIPFSVKSTESKYVFGSFFNDRDKNTINQAGYLPISPAPYFADADKVKKNRMDECKVGIYYSSEEYRLELEILCFVPSLLAFINENIEQFFAINNFGTRQSKGFGSFTIKGSNAISKTKFWFTVPINGNNVSDDERIKILNDEVDLFWKAIRGGVNDSFRTNGLYFKPLIFRYAKNARGLKWEKKAIKQTYFNNILQSKIEEHRNSPDLDVLTYDSPKPRLVRDMLGLSNQQTWKINDTEYSITKENSEIERFKSPITIKPVYYPKEKYFKIFLIMGVIPEELFGKEFIIRNSKQRESLPIQFPLKGEVSVTDFFNFAFGLYSGQVKFDINQVAVNNPNDPKFRKLKRIFSEIRKNNT